MNRRNFIAAGTMVLSGIAWSKHSGTMSANDRRPEEMFETLERRCDGRLGIAAVDLETGRRLSYRADERFPLCSTFKWLLAAQILARVDASQEQLTRPISFGTSDLLAYAPVTRHHVETGILTVSELCEAAVTVSDNTAANLLLRTIGGPEGLTAYLRSIGDPVTRLDRYEPELNSAIAGDPRDTTSPSAMVNTMRNVLTGNVLSGPSRTQLIAWLDGCTTGFKKLRAAFPASWRIGDKTGSGANGTSNDVAYIRPPQKKPLIIAAYLTGAKPAMDLDTVLADAGRDIAMWYSIEKE